MVESAESDDGTMHTYAKKKSGEAAGDPQEHGHAHRPGSWELQWYLVQETTAITD